MKIQLKNNPLKISPDLLVQFRPADAVVCATYPKEDLLCHAPKTCAGNGFTWRMKPSDFSERKYGKIFQAVRTQV